MTCIAAFTTGAPIVHGAIRVLGAVFAVGIMGSAVASLATLIDDMGTIFGKH